MTNNWDNIREEEISWKGILQMLLVVVFALGLIAIDIVNNIIKRK